MNKKIACLLVIITGITCGAYSLQGMDDRDGSGAYELPHFSDSVETYVSETDDKTESCSICSENFRAPYALSCNGTTKENHHTFCTKCIQGWISEKNNKGEAPDCPICRREIGHKDLVNLGFEAPEHRYEVHEHSNHEIRNPNYVGFGNEHLPNEVDNVSDIDRYIQYSAGHYKKAFLCGFVPTFVFTTVNKKTPTENLLRVGAYPTIGAASSWISGTISPKNLHWGLTFARIFGIYTFSGSLWGNLLNEAGFSLANHYYTQHLGTTQKHAIATNKKLFYTGQVTGCTTGTLTNWLIMFTKSWLQSRKAVVTTPLAQPTPALEMPIPPVPAPTIMAGMQP